MHLELFFQLDRIRPNSEPIGRADGSRLDANAGIEREHAALACEQGIDIELDDLWHIGRQLRELHQGELDRLQVDRRLMPVALQEPVYAGLRNQVPSERRVERWESERAITVQLDSRASLPEDDRRTEGRIDGHPYDELVCPTAPNHLLHREALDRGPRPELAAACEHGPRGLLQLLVALEIEGHAAHVGL